MIISSYCFKIGGMDSIGGATIVSCDNDMDLNSNSSSNNNSPCESIKTTRNVTSSGKFKLYNFYFFFVLFCGS